MILTITFVDGKTKKLFNPLLNSLDDYIKYYNLDMNNIDSIDIKNYNTPMINLFGFNTIGIYKTLINKNIISFF